MEWKSQRRALFVVALAALVAVQAGEGPPDPPTGNAALSKQVADAEGVALKEAGAKAREEEGVAGKKSALLNIARAAVAHTRNTAKRVSHAQKDAEHERRFKQRNARRAKAVQKQALRFSVAHKASQASKEARLNAQKAEAAANDAQNRIHKDVKTSKVQESHSQLGDADSQTQHKVTASKAKQMQDSVPPPSHRTQKDWRELASEANSVAKETMFYSKLLGKVSKTEHAYAGMLRTEKKTDAKAKSLQSKTTTLLDGFYGPNVGKGAAASSVELGEDASVGGPVESTDNLKTRVPTKAAYARAATAVEDNPEVEKLRNELAESRASASKAQAAEQEAEMIVKKQRAELKKAQMTATAPATVSKTTKELEQQQQQYKKAQTALQKQGGTVAQVAAKAASAAEEVARKQVKIAKQRDEARKEKNDYQQQADDGQIVDAAEKQEQRAVSTAEEAANKVKRTETQLSDAEHRVAHLQAQKAVRDANAVPLEMKALRKDEKIREKLSSQLEVLSERAQTGEAAQTHLHHRARRIRQMAIDVKNSAEEQYDRLSQKLGKDQELGESASEQPSKWKTGIKRDQSILKKQHMRIKAIVDEARKISLDASKIQERQYEAADASSQLEVNAHVMSQKLVRNKGDIHSLRSKSVTAKELKKHLKKMAQDDHKVYMDLSHLNGEAMNAASAEDAGVKETKNEMSLENALLNNLADDLLPR